jgi:hypothetical protein
LPGIAAAGQGQREESDGEDGGSGHVRISCFEGIGRSCDGISDLLRYLIYEMPSYRTSKSVQERTGRVFAKALLESRALGRAPDHLTTAQHGGNVAHRLATIGLSC